MGSTEPPSTRARIDAQTVRHELEMKTCDACGLPYDDGPQGFGTAGCPECDLTLRLRARRGARGARRHPAAEAA